jgi:hypothetical protein
MRKLIVLGAALASALVTAGAAGAAGDGATVIHDSGCVPNAFVTMCYEIHTVTNTATTPSGVTSYITNGTVDRHFFFTFSPDATYSRTNDVHDHVLRKGGELHQESLRMEEITAFDLGGGFAQTCVSTFNFAYANGETRLGEIAFECTSP